MKNFLKRWTKIGETKHIRLAFASLIELPKEGCKLLEAINDKKVFRHSDVKTITENLSSVDVMSLRYEGQFKRNESEETYSYANEHKGKDNQSIQENGKGIREFSYISYCLFFVVRLVIL